MRPALIVDIETVGHDCARDYVPAPDLSTITAAKNLKDPVKIDEDIRRRQTEAVADYEATLSRCALDWNLSRIVALGVADESGTIDAFVCHDEIAEATVLRRFWNASRGHDLIGFAARTFDLPTIIQRSRLLGVPHRRVDLGRYGRGDVTDLRDLLTFDDARYEAIMPRSLKAFCRRFGIPVDDAIDGSQIGTLVAQGRWDDVLSHVTSDVRLTLALARKLGVVEQPTAEVVL